MLCVFSVPLLISCRLYTVCCAHVAGNPWHCDCDGMYPVYRTFREGTGQNVTLLCKSPADRMGESWDVLEEMCEPTVTPPQPTVTGSTTNTTAVSTSQPVQFNTTVQQDVSVQESSPDASHVPSHSPLHLPTKFLVIFFVSLAALVLISIFVVNKVVRRLRRGTRPLDRFWSEDVVDRMELMSG